MPAVQVAQVAVPVEPVVLQVQDSVARAQASAVARELQPVQASVALVVPVVRVGVQALVADAVSVVEPPVPSVRAVHADHPRPESPSARNAKNTNKEPLLASVVQSFHAATATRWFVCVAVRASKTLPTRLMPTPVS